MIRQLQTGASMKRFIEGRDRAQSTLFPERLDEAIDADNPVPVVDAFIDALDLAELGFDVEPEATGRPGYHPAWHSRSNRRDDTNLDDQVEGSRPPGAPSQPGRLQHVLELPRACLRAEDVGAILRNGMGAAHRRRG